MTLPVKSLSEIEVKSEVSENDKILILDSETDEARLASKDELKGDKGDQGDPGTPGADGQDGKDGKDGADGKDGVDGAAATISVGTTSTGAAGTSASVTNSGTSSAAVFNFTIPKGDKGDQGVPGQDGQDGADGNGITSVTSSKNGKTTTVTMNFDEGDPYSFQIMDGADGQGSGDMLTSVYDPNNKAADVFDYDNFTNTPTLGTAAACNTGTSSGNVPVLDSNGKLSTTILPALAITDTFTVSTTSDLTGLSSAEKGDIAIVTGTSETYILSADPYSTSSNWKKLATPTDTVTSVNSKTGAVTLNADDISDSTTTNKFVTASDLTNLSNLSGTNTGDQSASDFDIKDLTDSTDLRTTWSGKQDALVNQTNIKSVNGNSLLGGGNLSLYSTTTATLTTAGWSSSTQTVSVTGVTASNTVIVSPTPSSISDYTDNGVYCSAQGSGTLTFTCDSTPSSDITVNIVIMS